MKDFTPVCTTEMIAFEKERTTFEKLNTKLLGLSIDSNPSHLAWVYDIFQKTGTKIQFPIIADRSGEIARKYGMLATNISNTETVRNVYIIDDKGIIRLILVYPLNIGRNIKEIIRCVRALQTAIKNDGATPVNWTDKEPTIISAPQTFPKLLRRVEEIQQDKNGMSWYLSFKV